MNALKKKIELYCELNKVEIPFGFHRSSPSKYVVIKRKVRKWQLTAMTWNNVSDVINYLNNYCENVEYKVLDFKNEVELKRRGKKQLERYGYIKINT